MGCVCLSVLRVPGLLSRGMLAAVGPLFLKRKVRLNSRLSAHASVA